MGYDLRAVLEGIVYGDNPKITPGDQVCAAEQLRAGVQPEMFHDLFANMATADQALPTYFAKLP